MKGSFGRPRFELRMTALSANTALMACMMKSGRRRPFPVVQHPILRSQVRTGSFPILDAQDWPVADWQPVNFESPKPTHFRLANERSGRARVICRMECLEIGRASCRERVGRCV